MNLFLLIACFRKEQKDKANLKNKQSNKKIILQFYVCPLRKVKT